ncbi:MAG: holo-ACP synthase [Actinomycetota bacterium]
MVGIDVVDIARFRSLLDRSPHIADRFFTPDELAHCAASKDHALHLAGTFAAKEAVMKALGLVPAVAWARRIEVARSPKGGPVARVEGAEVAVSISHDGPVAVAVAFTA